MKTQCLYTKHLVLFEETILVKETEEDVSNKNQILNYFCSSWEYKGNILYLILTLWVLCTYIEWLRLIYIDKKDLTKFITRPTPAQMYEELYMTKK